MRVRSSSWHAYERMLNVPRMLSSAAAICLIGRPIVSVSLRLFMVLTKNSTSPNIEEIENILACTHEWPLHALTSRNVKASKATGASLGSAPSCRHKSGTNPAVAIRSIGQKKRPAIHAGFPSTTGPLLAPDERRPTETLSRRASIEGVIPEAPTATPQ